MSEDITEFRGQNRWLSNFHEAPILCDGKVYPTTEHYYQSKRALNPEDEAKVIACLTPKDAMHMGRQLTNQRPFEEWEKLRVAIMFRATILKYSQHTDLANKLIETGNVRLVEGNWWGDVFWGESPIGTGQNVLGRVIMEVRDFLKKAIWVGRQ